VQVEVFDDGEIESELFHGEFDAIPRVGETITRDAGGFFRYFEVLAVWYREDSDGKVQACLSVKLND